MQSHPTDPAPIADATQDAIYAPLRGFYDGIFRSNALPRTGCARLVDYLEGIGPNGLREVQRDADLSLLNQGITFTVYADSRGNGEDLSARRDPAHRAGRALAHPRAGPSPANTRPQPVPRRPLRGSAHLARRPGTRGARPQLAEFLSRHDGGEGPERRLCPRRRHGSDRERGWRATRPRGQCARAVRRVLRAGESPRDVARHARPAATAIACGAWSTIRACCSMRCAPHRRRRTRESAC